MHCGIPCICMFGTLFLLVLFSVVRAFRGYLPPCLLSVVILTTEDNHETREPHEKDTKNERATQDQFRLLRGFQND